MNQVTHTHFWLKRNEIEKQCEEWISDMEGQVESDPNGSRAVSVGLASLKVIQISLLEYKSSWSLTFEGANEKLFVDFNSATTVSWKKSCCDWTLRRVWWTQDLQPKRS